MPFMARSSQWMKSRLGVKSVSFCFTMSECTRAPMALAVQLPRSLVVDGEVLVGAQVHALAQLHPEAEAGLAGRPPLPVHL